MSTFWRPWALITLLLHSFSASAIELKLIPALIANASAPTQIQSGSSRGWTGNLSLGFGLGLAITLGELPLDFESGIYSLRESSTREESGAEFTRTSRALHFPALFRFHLDSQFSFAAGGYSSLIQTNSSTGIHDRDFGILFSVQSCFHLMSALDFMIEGRYQHGLSNLATIPPGITGDVFNTRSIQAYAGLIYRFSVLESSTQSEDLSSPGL